LYLYGQYSPPMNNQTDPTEINVLSSEEYNSDIIISARLSEQHRKL